MIIKTIYANKCKVQLELTRWRLKMPVAESIVNILFEIVRLISLTLDNM